MLNVAIQYLSKNKIKHVGMLECIKYDNIDFLYAKEDGVFLYNKNAKLYMLSTDNEDTCKSAIEQCDNCKLIVCHNYHDYLLASEKFGLYGLNKCHQIVWQSKQKLPLKGVCEIKKLSSDSETVDFVYNNYTLAFDKEHVKYIIDNIGMYGAYYDGKLVGYIGRHEERSLGLLEILPEYRRLGIGTELEFFAMNDLIEKGEVPYGHIIYGNDKSVEMHKKIGYTFYDEPVYWIFTKK